MRVRTSTVLKKPFGLLAAVLLAALLLAALPSVGSATLQPLGSLLEPQRMVLFATENGARSSDFPLINLHFDLVDKAQQPRGTLDVIGMSSDVTGEPSTSPTGLLTFVATLADGTIVGQGLSGFAEPFTVAIAGGTGRYRSARGELRVVPLGDDGARLVFRLLP